MSHIAKLQERLNLCVRVDQTLLTREVDSLVDKFDPFYLKAYGTNGEAVFNGRVERSCKRIWKQRSSVTQERKEEFFEKLRDLVKAKCDRQYLKPGKGLARKVCGTDAEVEAIHEFEKVLITGEDDIESESESSSTEPLSEASVSEDDSETEFEPSSGESSSEESMSEGASESTVEPWGGEPSNPAPSSEESLSTEPSSEEPLSTEPVRNQRHVRFALEANGLAAQVFDDAERRRTIAAGCSNTVTGPDGSHPSKTGFVCASRTGAIDGEQRPGEGFKGTSQLISPDDERLHDVNSAGRKDNGPMSRSYHPNPHVGIETTSARRGEEVVAGKEDQGYTRREHMHAGRSGRQQAPSSAPGGKVVSVNQRAPPDRLAARQIRVRDDADGRFNLALGKSAINAILGKRRAEEWLEDQYPLLQKRGRYD